MPPQPDVVRSYIHTYSPELLNKTFVPVKGHLVGGEGYTGTEDISGEVTLLCKIAQRAVQVPIYRKGVHSESWIDEQVAAGTLKKVWVFKNPLDTPNFARTGIPQDIYNKNDTVGYSTPVGSITTDSNGDYVSEPCALFENSSTLAQNIHQVLPSAEGGDSTQASPWYGAGYGAWYDETTRKIRLFDNFEVAWDGTSEQWFFSESDYGQGLNIYNYFTTAPVFEIELSEWKKLTAHNENVFWANIKSTVRTGQFLVSPTERDEGLNAREVAAKLTRTIESLTNNINQKTIAFFPESVQAQIDQLDLDIIAKEGAIAAAQTNLSTLQNANPVDTAAVAAAEAQIAVLNSELDELNAEDASLTAQIQAFKTEMDELVAQVEKAEEIIKLSTGRYSSTFSHSQKLFKQEGKAGNYQNGFIPRAARVGYPWWDPGVGMNPVDQVVDDEWPEALSYSDWARVSANPCSDFGVEPYDSRTDVVDLYYDYMLLWSRFASFGYGAFPFEHGVRDPYWQSVGGGLQRPNPLERLAEWGPICSNGVNGVCVTYPKKIVDTPTALETGSLVDLNSTRVCDYIIADDNQYFGLLDNFLRAGPVKITGSDGMGGTVLTDLTVTSLGNDFLDIIDDVYAHFDWKVWFLQPGMRFEAYVRTDLNTSSDPEAQITPLSSIWNPPSSPSEVTPSRVYAPGAPTNISVSLVKPPSTPTEIEAERVNPPGISLDITLSLVPYPGIPTDLELTRALVPGIPTDLELTRALVPGAPTDLELTRVLVPGIPTDLELTRALVPGIPTDLELTVALVPGAPTDLALSRLLSPGAPTDLELSILPAPGIPSDLTLSILPAPGAPTDLNASRLLAPGVPNITGLSASDTATNNFIADGILSSGESGGSGESGESGGSGGSGDSSSSVITPITLSSPFGSPVFNFTDAEIQKLSNGAITIGGFYAIEVLPNTPPRLVLAEELTF